MGYKFAILVDEFYAVEMFAYFLYALGIAYGNDGVGDFFGTATDMVNGASVIDDELCTGDNIHIKNL
jgi:hypothetical protein